MTSATAAVHFVLPVAASAAIPIMQPAAPPVASPSPACASSASPLAAPPPDLSRLFREHRQALVGFVQRYTGSREDAEDAVQNAFMEALRGHGAAASGTAPSAWLFGLALSLARRDLAERHVPA